LNDDTVIIKDDDSDENIEQSSGSQLLNTRSVINCEPIRHPLERHRNSTGTVDNLLGKLNTNNKSIIHETYYPINENTSSEILMYGPTPVIILRENQRYTVRNQLTRHNNSIKCFKCKNCNSDNTLIDNNDDNFVANKNITDNLREAPSHFREINVITPLNRPEFNNVPTIKVTNSTGQEMEYENNVQILNLPTQPKDITNNTTQHDVNNDKDDNRPLKKKQKLNLSEKQPIKEENKIEIKEEFKDEPEDEIKEEIKPAIRRAKATIKRIKTKQCLLM